eukprot:s312_g6.t1
MQEPLGCSPSLLLVQCPLLACSKADLQLWRSPPQWLQCLRLLSGKRQWAAYGPAVSSDPEAESANGRLGMTRQVQPATVLPIART